MANITIMTNTLRYSYHSFIAQMITDTLADSSHIINILDINSTEYPHQCLAKLNSMDPDILITLDLAGFHFRTQSGENALNMLYTKNLNLVWGSRPEYAPYLNKKVSLSMLFYDATGEDNQLSQQYSNVLYYYSNPSYTFSEDCDFNTNSSNFITIWNHFLAEIDQLALRI